MEITQKEKYIIKILKDMILISLHPVDSKNIIIQNLMIEGPCLGDRVGAQWQTMCLALVRL